MSSGARATRTTVEHVAPLGPFDARVSTNEGGVWFSVGSNPVCFSASVDGRFGDQLRALAAEADRQFAVLGK